ncbi:hypothetical protein [Blastopirellula marina]|uniref:Uncharacterized protein n=1 Tax=Blastopirellula marina TaxID=124 RepID=A0A2S8FHD8_9BACT|nr:hypothetical protein [Blastopirellula marina]PQO31563.1 hypothetical protein C5Y98_19275 [Blastopirellula marina]PTL42869.1 hypothetical protein C5Y97_19285 [Blastopirellula marina]
MRLTLRTLLAHEHGLLNDQQAAVIAQKIEQSPFVLQLLRHLKDRAARPEIVPLSIDARGTASLDKVTGYLDYTLSADEVVKLENECFASDRLLAEVTTCHDILAQWLSTPAPLDPTLRQQLYALMPAPALALEGSQDEIAIDLPDFTFRTSAPVAPVAERRPANDPPAKPRSLVGATLQLLALSACVMGLVAFVVMNRGRVEEMIAQHWQQKTSLPVEQEQGEDVPTTQVVESNQAEPPPQKFVAMAVPLEKQPTDPPSPAEPGALPEVSVTAFHSPIRSAEGSSSDQLPGQVAIHSAQGAFFQRNDQAAWMVPGRQGIGHGRLVVSLYGHCELQRDGTQLQVGPVSELNWNDQGELSLRYGKIDLKLPPGQTMRLQAAGQLIEVVANGTPVQLRLSTASLSSAGIDFASAVMNQEIQIEGVSGEAHLAISSCRGPFPLAANQKVAAHRDQGVRSIDALAANQVKKDSVELNGWKQRLRTASDPVAQLQAELTSVSIDVQAASAMTLGQMGHWEALSQVWGQWKENTPIDPSTGALRELIAQDSGLASQLKATLGRQSPQHGPLIYRLVCGFSADQLNDATRSQLETLLRHPEPAVRVWARFQLGFSSVTSPSAWN